MDTNNFSVVNRARCESKDGFNHNLTDWTLSDWMVALGGEVGEAMNIVKKLNRYRDNIAEKVAKEGDSKERLHKKLLSELGDVYIYLDLICQSLGTTVEAVAVTAFDDKSRQLGMPFFVGWETPLDAGIKAYRRGEQRESNPYLLGGEGWTNWDQGWLQARSNN